MDYRSLYAYEYQYVQDLQDAGLEFGQDRAWSGTPPTPPASGVPAVKNDPTQSQMLAASASGVAVEGLDQVITLWAVGLSEDFSWGPAIGDIILLGGERWLIQRVASAMYGTQWICYCKSSPRNTR